MRARLCPLLVVGLLAASCGSGASPAPEGPGRAAPADRGPFPVTVPAANGKLRLNEAPERIVSLSPTATEILFAIDAGDRVVAVDDQSDHPPQAPTTELSGFQPNVEAIASYEPDLVVVSTEPGGLERSLDKLKIPVLLQPAARRLADTYAQIEELGAVTGQADEAEGLERTMRTDIERIAGSVPEPDRPPTYYHELD
ncbi:MAG: ABC transporter substrate-binding protein, partial [Actinomycetota bacterium]